MKKGLVLLAVCAMFISLLAGCGAKSSDKASDTSSTAAKSDLKVGMVTDSGTIDDKSFNQGTWEGIQQAGKDLGIKSKYLKPAGTTEADYLKEIGNLFDAGFKFIVTPGYKFETAIFAAQDKYKDAKFVLIDGSPHEAKDGAPNVVGANTVSLFFAEQEAGFAAGVAASLELKDGALGFIGGMEIPPVQKFNWGFQQGVKYANENLGTKMDLKKENIVYQGSFDNVAAGQQLAAQMYDTGVKAIFTAAGGVGVGAITEAKTRGNVWVIGVDVDQYADGMKPDGKSIILTSAVKKIDHATAEIIKNETEGKFPGGQTLTLDAKSDSVGIPTENPNLSKETQTKVNEIMDKIKSGEIVVKAEKGDLVK